MMLSLVISTHALREEGDVEGLMLSPDCEISTHALREEGDPPPRWLHGTACLISTHALREEGDNVYDTAAPNLL